MHMKRIEGAPKGIFRRGNAHVVAVEWAPAALLGPNCAIGLSFKPSELRKTPRFTE